MKPTTRKFIESGLVPKHTLLLMQRWGYLDYQSTDTNTELFKLTSEELKNGLIKFVEELDELLESEEDNDIKETSFSMSLTDPTLIFDSDSRNHVVVFKDEFGRLTFPPTEKPIIGARFKILETNKWYEITNVVTLWADSSIIAHQISTKFLDKNPYA